MLRECVDAGARHTPRFYEVDLTDIPATQAAIGRAVDELGGESVDRLRTQSHEQLAGTGPSRPIHAPHARPARHGRHRRPTPRRKTGSASASISATRTSVCSWASR